MNLPRQNNDRNTILGNKGRFDLSALRAPASSMMQAPLASGTGSRSATGSSAGQPISTVMPQTTDGSTQPQAPVDPANPQGNADQTLEQKQTLEKNLRLKIYGYFKKLPEMMGLVDFPTPITQIKYWGLEELQKLYDTVIESRDAESITGGIMIYNALVNAVEVFGIQYGYYLNGYAKDMMLENQIRNTKQRIAQLVTINEIEFGFGIQNPLVELGMLLATSATQRHLLQKDSNKTLFMEAQQFEPVPQGIVDEFRDL